MKIIRSHAEWHFIISMVFHIIVEANATNTGKRNSPDPDVSASNSRQQPPSTTEQQYQEFLEGIPDYERAMYHDTIASLNLQRKLPARMDLIILKHFPLLPQDAQTLIANIYHFYKGLPRFSPLLQAVENQILSAIYRYKYSENPNLLSLITALGHIFNDIAADKKKQADILEATNAPGNTRTLGIISSNLCNGNKIPNPTREYFQNKIMFEQIFDVFPNLPREACIRTAILFIVWKTLALDRTMDQIRVHYQKKTLQSIEAYFTVGSQEKNRKMLSVEILVILYNMLDIYEYGYIQHYKKATQTDLNAPLDFFSQPSISKTTTTQGPIGLESSDSPPRDDDRWSFLTDAPPTLSRPIKKARAEKGAPSGVQPENLTQAAISEPGWVFVFPSNVYPEIYLITRYMSIVKLQMNVQEVLLYFDRHCRVDEQIYGKVQWKLYSALKIYRNSGPSVENSKLVNVVLMDILARYGSSCRATTVRHKITLTPGSIVNDLSIVSPLPDFVSAELRIPMIYTNVPNVSGQQHQSGATSSQKSQGKQVEDTTSTYEFPTVYTDFMQQSANVEMTEEHSRSVPSLSEMITDDPGLSLQLSLMPSSNPSTPKPIDLSDDDKEIDS